MSVQPVVTVADHRAGWTGTDRQLVRDETVGRADTFIVIDEDMIRTLDRDTTLRPRSKTAWRFFGLNGRHGRKAR